MRSGSRSYRALERRLLKLVGPTARRAGDLRVGACIPDHIHPRHFD